MSIVIIAGIVSRTGVVNVMIETMNMTGKMVDSETKQTQHR